MDGQKLPTFNSLRAVLFDLDGTLIETHIDFTAMTAEMLSLAGEAGVPDDVTEGKDILSLVAAAAEDVSTRGGDGPGLRREAFARLEALEVIGCSRPTLLPGTRELLLALRDQGMKIGVVTRNCRLVSEKLLGQFDLPHDVLLTRDDVERTKPHPEHLWAALTHLEVLAADAAMVGDHWMDMEAGHRAGCAVTVGILGTNDAEWFAPCPPTALVRDPAAVLPLFTSTSPQETR
jgi:phosphoglycolate phosphatase